MTNPRKRIVLFLPQKADPEQHVSVHADVLPLELLQIAGLPDRNGYEVHIVDAMVHANYMERLMELCDGALLFGSSCILGFQVLHGAKVAATIRERFPELPILWGGWSPSVMPELFLKEGIADAVCLGQGELTFWEIVQALESGEDLMSVPGIALLREGEVIYTSRRAVVGFGEIPDVPWHLIDFEEYVTLQNDKPPGWKVRHRNEDPWDMKPVAQMRGFSYYSSFGCPEPCTFCCSPDVSARHWKAIPGGLLAERVLACHDRFGFNTLRFQDANFGVQEKRSNQFSQALIDAGSPFWWNGTYEVETIARYSDESLDRLAESHFHMAGIGAEAGSMEQQARIGKSIDIRNNLLPSLERLNVRRIQSAVSWIIGYPGETPQSMHDTITLAAKVKHRFPRSHSDVFTFCAIPGSQDFNSLLEMGYQPPGTLEEWGANVEYQRAINDTGIPHEVFRRWRRYSSASMFYDGLATEGSDTVRSLMKRISSWRLRNDCFAFPIEQKLFHLSVKLSAGRKFGGV